MERRPAEVIADWLRGGHLLPGSRLPSLRTLMALFACTRHAAHLAVLELERTGVLVRRSPRVFVVAGHAPVPGDLDRTLVVFANARTMRPPGARYTGGSPAALAGVEAEAARRGLRVSVFPPDPATLGRFAHLDRLRPHGWVFLNDVYGCESGLALLAAAVRSGRPASVWGDSLLPAELDALPCAAVLADQRDGAARLVEHLAGLGARHLLPVLLPTVAERGQRAYQGVWMRDRLAGYGDGAARAGVELLPAAPFLAPRYTTERAAFEEGCLALAGPIACQPGAEALLAPEDGAATALACAARRLGRPLPVAGFDATWRQRPEAAWGPPPAASIDQDWAGIGAALVAALEAPSGRPHRHHVRGRLVLGDGSRTQSLSEA